MGGEGWVRRRGRVGEGDEEGEGGRGDIKGS